MSTIDKQDAHSKSLPKTILGNGLIDEARQGPCSLTIRS